MNEYREEVERLKKGKGTTNRQGIRKPAIISMKLIIFFVIVLALLLGLSLSTDDWGLTVLVAFMIFCYILGKKDEQRQKQFEESFIANCERTPCSSIDNNYPKTSHQDYGFPDYGFPARGIPYRLPCDLDPDSPTYRNQC